MKIISTGEAGVDQAALACGLDLGLSIGGYCLPGGRAEDGAIPDRVRAFLTPITRPDPREAARKNVAEADAVLVLRDGPLSPRGAEAAQAAARLRKPTLILQLLDSQAAGALRAWVTQQKVQTLAVVGPRESRRPGIGDAAYTLLHAALEPVGTDRESADESEDDAGVRVRGRDVDSESGSVDGRAVALYEQGLSLAAVAEQLTREGFRTAAGRVWGAAAVRELFRRSAPKLVMRSRGRQKSSRART